MEISLYKRCLVSECLRGLDLQMGLGVGARKNRTFSTYRVRRMLGNKLIQKKNEK